jgi:RNA polymerase sigma-70 factor (ECF subfamily)
MGVRRHRNSYEGIDEYAIRLIRKKAGQLVGKVGFTEADREDLEQELIIDLLQRLSKFNPNRANRKTFITRVVTNRVATLIELQKTDRRNYRLYSDSLNDYIDIGGGDLVEREVTIASDEYLQNTGRCSRPLRELEELSLDIERIIAKLPPKTRNLCERLKREKTISDVAREMGITRETVYQSIKELRKSFEKSGVKKYL